MFFFSTDAAAVEETTSEEPAAQIAKGITSVFRCYCIIDLTKYRDTILLFYSLKTTACFILR